MACAALCRFLPWWIDLLRWQSFGGTLPSLDLAHCVHEMSNFVDRTIWTGDNLDILCGLNSVSIDIVYLDPPFNSNRNYAAPVGGAAGGA